MKVAKRSGRRKKNNESEQKGENKKKCEGE